MKRTVMDDQLFDRQVTALEAIAEHLENLVFETASFRLRHGGIGTVQPQPPRVAALAKNTNR